MHFDSCLYHSFACEGDLIIPSSPLEFDEDLIKIQVQVLGLECNLAP
jgi:hypothetical protein